MRAIVAFMPGVALVLFNLGWDMIAYQNPTLGLILWIVSGVLLLIPIAFWTYGVVRERNELRPLKEKLQTVEGERDALQRQVGELQSHPAPPSPSELKALCSHLADELEEEDKRYQDGEAMIKLWVNELEESGTSESDIDQQVGIAQDENFLGTLSRYNKRHKKRLLKLYDVLGPQGWFSPADRYAFENFSDPDHLDHLAERLREVCGKLSGGHENGVRAERLEEELRETKQKRDELKQENEELIAELDGRPDSLPDTFEEWMDTSPLLTIANRTFRNDRVELDGCHYANCVFDACTFSFKETKPFRVAESCRIEGGCGIDARAPQALAILIFLKSFGALHHDTEYLDTYDGGPVD